MTLRVLALGLLAAIGSAPRANGAGHGGGHGGGHAPHVSAPRAQAYRAPRMPRTQAPSRNQISRPRAIASRTPAHHGASQGHFNASVAHNKSSSTHGNSSTSRGQRTQARVQNLATTSTSTNRTGSTTTGGVTPATMAALNAHTSLSGNSSPYRYTYGLGAAARSYRAYGYGRGYRNRYYGAGYGYGRSQSLNRGIVSRLRSVHASLARIDHDYQGHRIRAMHAIQMAIRQLSHRSMVYAAGMNNGMGMNNGGMNNALGMNNRMGMRRSVLGGGGGFGRRPMSQAQSDARMSQALRNLQGIGMQLNNQGYNTMNHARAIGHIQQAMHELNVALTIR